MNTFALKELANDNITKIFDAFNLDYVDKYDYYQMSCPIHGGDNNTAFSWVKNGGYFRCFTRRCENKGADVFDFVRKLKKCSFAQAKKIVASIVVDDDYEQMSEADLVAEAAFQRYIKNNAPKKKTGQIFSPDILKKLKPHPYLLERGFSQEVLDDFNAGYCDNPESKFYRRYCLPVTNPNGGIIGFTGRAVFDWEAEGKAKWRHTDGMPKSETFFNFHRAKEHIQKTGRVILVEGPLDVLKFEMAGIKNAVAILGSSLSGPQRSLLLENECYEIVMAFDNDKAGEMCTNEVKRMCSDYFTLYKYIIPEAKDIGDLNVETIKNLDIIKAND
jgi:DNA primase